MKKKKVTRNQPYLKHYDFVHMYTLFNIVHFDVWAASLTDAVFSSKFVVEANHKHSKEN